MTIGFDIAGADHHTLDGDETAHTFAADMSKGYAFGDGRHGRFGQVLLDKGKEAAATAQWQNAQFVTSQEERRKVLGGARINILVIVLCRFLGDAPHGFMVWRIPVVVRGWCRPSRLFQSLFVQNIHRIAQQTARLMSIIIIAICSCCCCRGLQALQNVIQDGTKQGMITEGVFGCGLGQIATPYSIPIHEFAEWNFHQERTRGFIDIVAIDNALQQGKITTNASYTVRTIRGFQQAILLFIIIIIVVVIVSYHL
jgi:hypothetical protein